MAVIIDNPHIIDTPPAGRTRYGLFDAATVTADLTDRMIASGFQFAALDCGISRIYNSQCLPSENAPKVMDEGLTYMEAHPMWVIATRECGSVGTTPAEFSDSVRRRLRGAEQERVEQALWDGGGIGHFPNLTTNVGTVTVIPSAPGAGAAIAELESSFYANHGYEGVIHVNTAAYGAMAYAELVEDRSTRAGVLTTPLGSKWSFGAGYARTGPGGAAPAAGFVWAFMTSAVVIKHSDIIMQDDPRYMLNRSTNQWTGVAERVYAYTWTCPTVYAVQVPLAAPATAVTPAVP